MEKTERIARTLTLVLAGVLAAACGESPDAAARRAVAGLKTGDATALASVAHPTKGIRFTPYTRVDTTKDRRLSRDEILALWPKTDSLVWGAYDGTGDPIRLSFRQYFDRFVHDFDVAVSPRVARDSMPMGTGNSLNNIREAYPGATIVEYNTPGTDPRFGGMDWRSLWVVLESVDGKWYVVGLVHGAWTI